MTNLGYQFKTLFWHIHSTELQLFCDLHVTGYKRPERRALHHWRVPASGQDWGCTEGTGLLRPLAAG